MTRSARDSCLLGRPRGQCRTAVSASPAPGPRARRAWTREHNVSRPDFEERFEGDPLGARGAFCIFHRTKNVFLVRHTSNMAEGGNLPTDISGKDHPDAGGDDKNTSLLFTPGDSFTPCHGGKQHEMSPMGEEHSVLHSTTAETSLMNDNDEPPLLPNVDAL